MIELLTGVNYEVIAASPKYKFNTYFIIVLIIIVLLANWLLIPILGINGAALSSLIAIFITNTIRTLVLYHFYKFQPFTWAILWISLIIAGTYLITIQLNLNYTPFVNILIRGSLITFLFWTTILLSKVSPDLNQLSANFFNKSRK